MTEEAITVLRCSCSLDCLSYRERYFVVLNTSCMVGLIIPGAIIILHCSRLFVLQGVYVVLNSSLLGNASWSDYSPTQLTSCYTKSICCPKHLLPGNDSKSDYSPT